MIALAAQLAAYLRSFKFTCSFFFKLCHCRWPFGCMADSEASKPAAVVQFTQTAHSFMSEALKQADVAGILLEYDFCLYKSPIFAPLRVHTPCSPDAGGSSRMCVRSRRKGDLYVPYTTPHCISTQINPNDAHGWLFCSNFFELS